MPFAKWKIDDITGLDVGMIGWAPSLRYLLRRDRVLDFINPISDRLDILEVGCGAGALLSELSCSGHSCIGVETSERAIELANSIAKVLPNPPVFNNEIDVGWEGRFDVLISLDVLEHIEDDMGALREWVSLLRLDGHAIISVPAHERKWGYGDIWAGHYRRYEKDQLHKLAEKAGLRVLSLECYGYPLANITEWIGNIYYKYQMRRGGILTKTSATAASGVDRNLYTKLFPVLRTCLGRALIRCALKMQKSHVHADSGSGYILLAIKE